ncbi:NUDIX hydrolase domain [Cordyceps militaris]|uniref:NUDIX hydrolase domain n=1 Tax=Cordyceps militaris TaxID=73501 RepID=A0A2H4SHW5_CORMI|nr:NUDIX hydrolase domain [Cordyceps militaris]
MVEKYPRNSTPRAGVSCIILNEEGKALVGVRKGSHGAGTLQFPGGKMDYGEEILDCAVRETCEETGLEVEGIKVITYTNDIFEAEAIQFITMYPLCKMKDCDAVPEIKEPDKCEGWWWCDLAKLYAGRDGSKVEVAGCEGKGAPLFTPLKNLFQQVKSFDELLRMIE